MSPPLWGLHTPGAHTQSHTAHTETHTMTQKRHFVCVCLCVCRDTHTHTLRYTDRDTRLYVCIGGTSNIYALYMNTMGLTTAPDSLSILVLPSMWSGSFRYNSIQHYI
eukprot:GHVR01142937.1.p1 GENE.GHVR01142937.1~~GHVR01142937.1.p1  ORF type:complete len:108 (-),score=39.35 GHVR01142937.1:299-622(-)